ncbi:MAG: phosphate/phosphite/phosphonate ABC transporter substrate-binding protein [Gammaproteobacteria bacterium]|nr:phosphate/phosphite/phosphonate ABC transporter substrate-binding protein [Gammaproteobacteria bacterium]
MHTSKKALLIGGLMASLMAASLPAQATVTIGVLAPRGELIAMKQWSAFGKYLSSQIGDTVEIKPYGPRDLVTAAADNQVDFTLANPTQAIILQDVHQATPLATLNKKSGSQFAGVIVAKKGSGITKAEDLKGKKVMSLKFRAAAGAYTFQTYHLMQKGIDPHKDFASFKEGKKQDDLVLAVKAGVIDAAFVRSGLLENMAKEGKIKLEDFEIVDQRTGDGFPHLHSTDLYPEWYLFSLQNTDAGVAGKIKTASINLKAGDDAAKDANIEGFVEPVSLDGMKAALKALKIKPYDK